MPQFLICMEEDKEHTSLQGCSESHDPGERCRPELPCLGALDHTASHALDLVVASGQQGRLKRVSDKKKINLNIVDIQY